VVPTKHRRIAVTEDEELSEALARARPAFPRGTPLGTMVHDLAVKGAETVVRSDEERRAALRRIAEWSTSPDGMDRDALRAARASWGGGWPDW
jgi:hypothetical protein